MEGLFDQVAFWHWLAFGVFIAALEILIPGTIMLWIGMGAIVTGLAKLALPELGWEYQLMVWAIFSVVAIVLSLRFLKRHPGASDEPDLNDRGGRMVGRLLTLDEPIVNGFGRIRVGDTVWRVRGEDHIPGTTVRVVAMEGTTLVVERV